MEKEDGAEANSSGERRAKTSRKAWKERVDDELVQRTAVEIVCVVSGGRVVEGGLYVVRRVVCCKEGCVVGGKVLEVQEAEEIVSVEVEALNPQKLAKSRSRSHIRSHYTFAHCLPGQLSFIR